MHLKCISCNWLSGDEPERKGWLKTKIITLGNNAQYSRSSFNSWSPSSAKPFRTFLKSERIRSQVHRTEVSFMLFGASRRTYGVQLNQPVFLGRLLSIDFFRSSKGINWFRLKLSTESQGHFPHWYQDFCSDAWLLYRLNRRGLFLVLQSSPKQGGLKKWLSSSQRTYPVTCSKYLKVVFIG